MVLISYNMHLSIDLAINGEVISLSHNASVRANELLCCISIDYDNYLSDYNYVSLMMYTVYTTHICYIIYNGKHLVMKNNCFE